MTNTLTNTMTNTYVVIFLSVSIFGRGYHSRYQNFEFTGLDQAIVISFGKCRKAHGIAEKNISCLQGASICIYDDLETF